LAWLAGQLNEAGVRLMEVRVVLDVEADIVEAVNALRARYAYVLTTGGIGPTHDDITTACIAKAFGVKVVRDATAEAILAGHYGEGQLNAARLKMADVPEGADLIPNPVSAAPGYRIGNVYVMAGVPRIMQAMFGFVKPTLKGGAPMVSEVVTGFKTEGPIAAELAAIQGRYPDIEIGSYPFVKDGKLGTSLVARGVDAEKVRECAGELQLLMNS
jgi:molybdopterin-biosynthesis enzyme MoeA-like protein